MGDEIIFVNISRGVAISVAFLAAAGLVSILSPDEKKDVKSAQAEIQKTEKASCQKKIQDICQDGVLKTPALKR